MTTVVDPDTIAPDYAYERSETILAETRCALLLVDCENRFIYPGGDTRGPAARVVEPIATLLALARERAIPRIYVSVRRVRGAREIAAGPWRRRIAGLLSDDVTALKGAPRPYPSAWDETIPAPIAPLHDEPHLTKYRVSAFHDTGLDVVLREMDVRSVVIVGVASYGCIVSSCIDASSRGFFPFVPVECTAGARADLHDAALKLIGKPSLVTLRTVHDAWQKPA